MARIGVHLTKFHCGEKLIPLYTPRTSYKAIIESDERLLSDISLNFDKYMIGIMKKQFSIRNWEMRLREFINIVQQHLIVWQVDLPITINFDFIEETGKASYQPILAIGILEWDEFTNYIIEKATILKNLRVKSE
jgi:hypothetical protein